MTHRSNQILAALLHAHAERIAADPHELVDASVNVSLADLGVTVSIVRNADPLAELFRSAPAPELVS